MLKNTLLASALCLSVYALSTTAEASRAQGWYVGIEAGTSWVDTAKVERLVMPVVPPQEARFDTDLAMLATAGYRWENNWRVEFEGGYRDNEVTCAPTTAPCQLIGGKGWDDLAQLTAMVNVVHDIPLGDGIDLSVGLGVGGDYLMIDGPGFTNSDDFVFAAQALFQLSREISPGIDFVLSYRFLTTDAPAFRRLAVPFEIENDTHTISIGLRFDLEPDAAPVMAETTPPVVNSAPPAITPPAPRQYIVYFGFNRANLTTAARQTVREAADAAMRDGFVAIRVTGHTDTVGSAKYNMLLSKRRAAAVTSELVSRGIPAKGITSEGRGETVLLVQTGDRSYEPRNRRAEINVD